MEVILLDGVSVELVGSKTSFHPDYCVGTSKSSYWIRYEDKWYSTDSFFTRSWMEIERNLRYMTIEDIKLLPCSLAL